MTIPWQLNHVKYGSTPWAVQVEAMARSEPFDRYAYLMDMGLGKTATAINKFLASDCNVMVNICPNSFKFDWALAFKLWGVPEIKTGVWPKDPLPMTPGGESAYSINYEGAKEGGFYKLIELMKKRRVFLNFDETSALKHFDSAISRRCLELSKYAWCVTELNGTPFTQSVMDFYIPLRMLRLLPKLGPVEFRKRYAKLGGYMGKQIIGIQEDREEELWKIVDSRGFRAKKSEWRKDLPDRLFSEVHVEMSDKQISMYREMQEDFFTAFGALEVDAPIILTQMDKLRQISSGVLMKDGRHEFLVEPKNNPKVKAALEISGGPSAPYKTIVVYHYRPVGQILSEAFTKAEMNPVWLKGGMDPDEITAEKRRFNEDPSCRLAIVQQEGFCMGHDFIGSEGNDRATHMVFFENGFNLRDRLQMLDRNYRGEADQQCMVYDLVASPADQNTVDTLGDKFSIADRIDRALTALRARI